jgi:hypothetical protein
MLGKHCLKHWSSTQSSVTLSSGEAEFHGLVKGAAAALGQQALFQDLGVAVPLRLWTDSSAAVGITTRQGLGKLRHVDTKTLWLQQAARTGRVEVRKVAGLANPADLFTKHSLAKERILELVKILGCKYEHGRPEAAPALRAGQRSGVSMADAEEQGLTAEIEAVELTLPVMPHLALSEEELDELYPALNAPDEPDDSDHEKESNDVTLTAGLKIAKEIANDMAVLGRTRREGDVREQSMSKDSKDIVNYVSGAYMSNNVTDDLNKIIV